MTVVRGNSYIYDYVNLTPEIPDGTGPIISIEDRVPHGKYAVVRKSQNLDYLANASDNLGLAGLIFVLGDSTNAPITWNPDPAASDWRGNQAILLADKLKNYAVNGQIYGPQTLRKKRLVVGAMFILGNSTINSISDAISIASIVNRLDLDFIILDITSDAPNNPWAGSDGRTLLTICSQVLDHCLRPPMPEQMPRLSHFRPIFVVLPETTSGYTNLLNSDNSMDIFNDGFVGPKVFPMPRVPASSSPTLGPMFQWAAPPTQSAFMVSRCEVLVDVRSGIQNAEAIVNNAITPANRILNGTSWTPHCGVVVYDDIEALVINNSAPGNNPTDYWDFDKYPVKGCYVPIIFPYPVISGISRSPYEFKINSRGYPDDNGTETAGLQISVENWKTGSVVNSQPTVISLTDGTCNGNFKSIFSTWIHINGTYLKDPPFYGFPVSNWWDITGTPIYGDEGIYPFLVSVQSVRGAENTEFSFSIPIYNPDVNVSFIKTVIDYSQPIIRYNDPRKLNRKIPYEWSPLDQWCSERDMRNLPSVPSRIVPDQRTQADTLGQSPMVGATFLAAPLEIQAVISKYFPPSQWENAAIVSKCESGWNPSSQCNSLDPNNRCYGEKDAKGNLIIEDSRGLFQINVASNSYPEYANYDLYDPDVNTNLASQIFIARGWQPWSCAAKYHLTLDPPVTYAKRIAVGAYGWVYPTDSHIISQGGTCQDHINRITIPAIDIVPLVRGVTGDNLYAVDNGVILQYGWDPRYPPFTAQGYGIMVDIQLSSTPLIIVRYGHLDPSSLNSILLPNKVGDKVMKGDVIGYMDTTGGADGAHLHFEVMTNGMINGTRDCPTKYLPF